MAIHPISTIATSTGAARPVALITGASRGLGFLLARELADRGFALVICARSSDGLEAAADELRGFGGPLETVEADVGVEEQARRVVAVAAERFGRLDLLVTNAGIIQVGPVEELRPEDYAEIMDSTFWGTVHTTLAALPLLQRTAGRVLAVTSIGGKLPAPHLLPYTAAKHAAVGFAEGMRVEAAAKGVSVTVAVPGLMRTGSTRNALFAGDRQKERSWFTAAGSLPVVSMDAERAARRLIKATLRGRPEVILTPLAKVGVRVHGLAPATTLRAVGLVNRLLPGPTGSAGSDAGAAGSGGSDRPQPGYTTGRLPRWIERLARRDRDAAHRWHELDDPVPAKG